MGESDADRERLFALLDDFPNVALLSGHSKDKAGIPDATMADGAPNGHAMRAVAGDGGYALDWRPARASDPSVDGAMALHAPEVLRQGSWPGQAVHANVFMGMDDTRVGYRIDGGDWHPMQHVSAPDPRVVAEHRVEVRAFDRWQGERRARRSYELVEGDL